MKEEIGTAKIISNPREEDILLHECALLMIGRDCCIPSLPSGSTIAYPCLKGEFMGRSVVLDESNKTSWVIKRDTLGQLLLIPYYADFQAAGKRK